MATAKAVTGVHLEVHARSLPKDQRKQGNQQDPQFPRMRAFKALGSAASDLHLAASAERRCVMNLTPFDKAILAAIFAPLTVWVTSYLNGGDFDSKNLIAAVVAAVVAGLGVYAKGNKPAST